MVPFVCRAHSFLKKSYSKLLIPMDITFWVFSAKRTGSDRRYRVFRKQRKWGWKVILFRFFFIKIRSAILYTKCLKSGHVTDVNNVTRSSATAERARVVPRNHVLPKPWLSGRTITLAASTVDCRWQYGSSLGEFDAAGFESCRIVWHNA